MLYASAFLLPFIRSIVHNGDKRLTCDKRRKDENFLTDMVVPGYCRGNRKRIRTEKRAASGLAQTSNPDIAAADEGIEG
jgi:hypothetical protein